MFVYITSSSSAVNPPSYLYTTHSHIVTWKISNVKKPTANKYELFETLIRKMAKPYQS